MESNFTDLLTAALQRAARAHEAYQQTNGTDPNWPEWYADQMTRSLADDRERLHDVLLSALHSAHAGHSAYERDELGGAYHEEWAEWYSEHMVKILGDDASKLVPGITAFSLV